MAESENIDEEIDAIIATSLRVDEDDFGDDTSFGPEGLNAESLDIVEMAEALDVNLGIAIPDDELNNLETVGDVKEYVRDNL